MNEMLNEKAESKAQQRLFGMALAVRRGELDPEEVGKKVRDLANSDITNKEIKKFAKTKLKGLPKHVTNEGKEYYQLTEDEMSALIENSIVSFTINEDGEQDNGDGLVDDEQFNEFVNNFKPEFVKFNGNPKDGYSVQIQNANDTQFKIWVDVSIDKKYNDVNVDWNQYIFHLDNSIDAFRKRFQENTEMFELCTSEAVWALEKAGKIYQDEQAFWHYSD